MRLSVLGAAWLILLGLQTNSLPGQITTGSITGTTVDATKGVIPGVILSLTHESTQTQRKTITDSNGVFQFNFLPLGEYSIRAEFPGFETVLEKGIQVRVNDTINVDLKMNPSQTHQVVEVTGSVAPLQSQSGEVSGVVEHKAIENLPLNGRSFVQLVALEPGGVSTTKLAGGGVSYVSAIYGGMYSIHGSTSNATGFLFDGMSVRNAVTSFVGVQPPVDTIEEFKFQSANYSAAFGQSAGGLINIASRSGTNSFHGAASEFLRNNVFDARNFFDPAKPPYRRNQFGGVIGGPIIKNKTFFFAGYEGFRYLKGISREVTVPTMAQRSGNFSGGATIYDPSSLSAAGQRSPYPNNRIPISEWSPVSINALNRLYPLPDLPGNVNNLQATAPETGDSNIATVRVDHELSTTDTLFARYTGGPVHRITVWGTFVSLPNFPQPWDSSGYNAAMGETHIFGPGTTNELRYGFNRSVGRITDADQTEFVSKGLGINGLTTDPSIQGNPVIAISGLQSTGVVSNTPNDFITNRYRIWDNFSHIIGRHTLSLGGNFDWVEQNHGATPNARGTFSFTGTFTAQLNANTSLVAGTGQATADFLLGFPRAASVCCLTADAFKNFQGKMFGSYIQDDWKVSSHLTLNLGLRYDILGGVTEKRNRFSQPDLADAPNAVILVAGQNGAPRSFKPTRYTDFSPRFGFAYSAGQKTVIRGGFGVFYDETALIYIWGMNAQLPFTDQNTYTSSAVTPQLTLANPIPTGALATAIGASPNFGMINPNVKDEHTLNWNFSVQRNLFAGIIFTTSYIGNQGRDMIFALQANSPLPGPGTIGPRRPIPGFGVISEQGNYGRSWYHGLELKAERRMTKNVSFLGSYVYSKCLDRGGSSLLGDGSFTVGRNPRDVDAEKGLCTYDERNRVTGSSQYAIPYGAGRSGILPAILGNWNAQAIVSFDAGQPFSALLAYDNSNTGINADYPDLVLGQNPNSGVRTPTSWINKAAFTTPAAFTFGNAGRDIIIGPGMVQLDTSLRRLIPITDRQSLEFRAEIFNLLNHPNFLQPGNKFGTAAFGVIGGALDPRDIQFSLKYRF